jgi:hypothetical protein
LEPIFFLRMTLRLFVILTIVADTIFCQNIGNFQRPINQNPFYQQDVFREQDLYNQQVQQQFLNNPNRPNEYNLYQKPIYQVNRKLN